eukprot:11235096-Alexandrium_andersonii.AAC.1
MLVDVLLGACCVRWPSLGAATKLTLEVRPRQGRRRGQTSSREQPAWRGREVPVLRQLRPCARAVIGPVGAEPH